MGNRDCTSGNATGGRMRIFDKMTPSYIETSQGISIGLSPRCRSSASYSLQVIKKPNERACATFIINNAFNWDEIRSGCRCRCGRRQRRRRRRRVTYEECYFGENHSNATTKLCTLNTYLGTSLVIDGPTCQFTKTIVAISVHFPYCYAIV